MPKDSSHEHFKLTNGVRLILVPMEGVNSVATSVMVAVGSRYEAKEINGASHFLEHMVFKGTKKYPTTDDVNIVEKIGGLQNAYTDVDITSFHNKVLSTDWQLALEVNRELALSPLIEKKHIDHERNVILEEMKRYEDEPEIKVEETFHKMMYPGTKLGMRIIGEEASLRHIQDSILKEYHEKWYRPGRMVVVIAGNLKNPTNPINPSATLRTNPTNKIKEKVEEWFGAQPTTNNAQPTTLEGFEAVVDQQNQPKLEVVTKRDAQQTHLELGFRTFRRGSEERFAWNLFNLLMGVSFTSRLFREIREKRGLCYHIRSSSNNWADVGYWSIYAGVATEKVEEATRAILAELAKAKEKGAMEEEVAVAKKRIKTMLSFKSEDPEFMGEWYGRQEIFNEPIMTLKEYVARIEKVTKVEIDNLVRKYLKAQTINLALVWNKPRDEKLERLLRV